MAELDAKVQPTQDPNWMFFSRPGTEQPRGNEGMKELAQGVDKAFVGGLDFADKSMEQHVQNTVFDVEQKNRMDFINTAQGLKNDSSVNRGQAEDILSGNTLDNAPQAVKTAVQKVQTVSQAHDAGKVDKFGYFQRVIPELQAVRAQYPGYRHVVDQALGNNANAEMNTMVQELNRRDSEAREDGRRQQNEVMSLNKEGLLGPNGTSLVLGMINGKVDYPTVLKAAAPYISQNYAAKAAQRSKEILEFSNMQAADKVGADAGSQAKSIYGAATTFPFVASGQAGPTGDQDIARLREMVASGKVDPLEAETRARRIEMHLGDADAAYDKWANTPYANGKTPLQMLGKEKLDQYKTSNRAYLETTLALAGDPKTYPLSKATSEQIKLTAENDQWAALTNPQTEQFVRSMNWMGHAFGEANVPFVYNNFMAGSGDTMDKGISALAKFHYANIYSGTPDKDGNKPTVGDAVKDGADKGVPDPAYFRGFLNQAHYVADPSDKVPHDVKKNIADAFFAPTESNRNLIASLQSSHYDGRRWHTGAEDAFQDLTSTPFVKQIIKFADPELSKNYQNTLDVWTKTLLNRNIGTLNDALTQEGSASSVPTNFHNPGGAKNTTTTPAIKLTWDTERNVPDITPEARRYLIQTRQRGVLDAITKLQMVSGNMGNVLQTVKDTGYGQTKDMRVYILKMLQTEGLDIQDLPATKELQKAIEATAPRKAAGEAQE